MTASQEAERKLDIGYDDFAERPFYRRVNASLLRLAPCVDTVVDLATGTGAMTKIAFELDRVVPSEESSIYGFDIDPSGFDIAKKKVAEVNKTRVQTYFFEGSFNNIGLPPKSRKLAILANGPHLSDNLDRTNSELSRVLVDKGLEISPDDIAPIDDRLFLFYAPDEKQVPLIKFELDSSFYELEGGIALTNTAYVKGLSYPEGTDVVWRDIVIVARQKLRKTLNITRFEHPVDRFKYTEGDFIGAAEKAGFPFVQSFAYTADMDVIAIQAICKYGEFALGALPGVPTEQAAQALFDAVPEVFDKYGIKSIPRTWGLFVMRK